jgi:urea carboxylase-associated protein 1
MSSTVPGRVISEATVAAGRPWGARIRKGDVLRIVDIEGRQGVDFLCYNADEPEERYHAPNTMKKARRIALEKGDVLYSDVARPLMTVVADTCGNHDTIGGCCSAPSNQMLYGVKNVPGCRENFLAALKQFGLGRKDIVPNINFFCNVPVSGSYKLGDTVFQPGASKPGDYIELQAEMDVLAVLSNCPQVNNPCNDGAPTPIKVVVWRK